MNIYRIATYLDPRYKGKFFSSSITQEVQAAIVALCDQTEVNEPAKKRLKGSQPTSHTPTPSTSATVSEAMSLLLTSSSSDENDEPPHAAIPIEEVKKYHKEKRINGTSEDTLKWWSQKKRD